MKKKKKKKKRLVQSTIVLKVMMQWYIAMADIRFLALYLWKHYFATTKHYVFLTGFAQNMFEIPYQNGARQKTMPK